MPAEIGTRWRRMVWLAQVAGGPRHRGEVAREEAAWRQVAHDAWSYTRHVRDSLTAVMKSEPLPPPVPHPEPFRDAERFWAYKPPAESGEPDYTDWIHTRFGASGMVTLADGTKKRPEPEV